MCAISSIQPLTPKRPAGRKDGISETWLMLRPKPILTTRSAIMRGNDRMKLTRYKKTPKTKSLALLLCVLLLIAILTGCSSKSAPRSPDYVPDSLPPMPQEGRQGIAPDYCLPSCTERLTQQREEWRQRLTGPEQQG